MNYLEQAREAVSTNVWSWKAGMCLIGGERVHVVCRPNGLRPNEDDLGSLLVDAVNGNRSRVFLEKKGGPPDLGPLPHLGDPATRGIIEHELLAILQICILRRIRLPGPTAGGSPWLEYDAWDIRLGCSVSPPDMPNDFNHALLAGLKAAGGSCG